MQHTMHLIICWQQRRHNTLSQQVLIEGALQVKPDSEYNHEHSCHERKSIPYFPLFLKILNCLLFITLANPIKISRWHKITLPLVFSIACFSGMWMYIQELISGGEKFLYMCSNISSVVEFQGWWVLKRFLAKNQHTPKDFFFDSYEECQFIKNWA